MRINEYFHETSTMDKELLIKHKTSLGFIMKNYKQPKWCGYDEALAGKLGCWALMDIWHKSSKPISLKECQDCHCFIKP